MSDLEKYRHLNQDDWKRTQVRMPQDTYERLSLFAQANKLSLNSALISLIENSLDNQANNQKSEKQLQIENVYEKVEKLLNKLEEKDFFKEKPTD